MPRIPVLKRMRGAFFGGSIGQYNAAVASIHGGKAAGGDSHNFPERGAVLQQGVVLPPVRAVAKIARIFLGIISSFLLYGYGVFALEEAAPKPFARPGRKNLPGQQGCPRG